MSINQIAASAGVTRGALYHHFESKESLFENVFSEIEGELVAATAAAVAGRTASDALLIGCNAYIRLASQPETGRIVLIDAPAVLGLARYRNIDESFFLPSLIEAIRALRTDDSDTTVALLASAIFAAVCQLALIAHQQTTSPSDMKGALQILFTSLSRTSD